MFTETGQLLSRMHHADLRAFLKTASDAFAKGPVALVIAEDEVEVGTTLSHNALVGFRRQLLFAPPQIVLDEALPEGVHRIDFDTSLPDAATQAVNAVIDAAPERTWLYYCYNAEFLFFPFCETRTISEMLDFHAQERRDAMLTYVVDLYAGDLGEAPAAVSLEDAHLDASGYYALARHGPDGAVCERQLDFFGGLHWRFEEHIPEARRRIDRIAIFRSRPDLTLLPDHTFNDPEYNTYSCPWHHNLTAAIASFRTAKALRANAGSAHDISTFQWYNSVEFEWHSQQLLDLGLMEPGQWF